MKVTDGDRPQQLKIIIKRASIAYAGAIAMVVLTVIYSIAHHAGWTPALAGLPLYITMFVAITYKLVTDLRERRKMIKELDLGSDVRKR